MKNLRKSLYHILWWYQEQNLLQGISFKKFKNSKSDNKLSPNSSRITKNISAINQHPSITYHNDPSHPPAPSLVVSRPASPIILQEALNQLYQEIKNFNGCALSKITQNTVFTAL
jgi:hypothetical protein